MITFELTASAGVSGSSSMLNSPYPKVGGLVTSTISKFIFTDAFPVSIDYLVAG
jgi:hypothetical protein